MTIKLDFSNLPGDVGVFLSRQQHTRDLADALSRILSLVPEERDLIHQEIVSSVATVVDEYLAARADHLEQGGADRLLGRRPEVLEPPRIVTPPIASEFRANPVEDPVLSATGPGRVAKLADVRSGNLEELPFGEQLRVGGPHVRSMRKLSDQVKEFVTGESLPGHGGTLTRRAAVERQALTTTRPGGGLLAERAAAEAIDEQRL